MGHEDLVYIHKRHVAAVGYQRDETTLTRMTYEELRPGCYDPVARVEDNELNHVAASLCFPTFPRFCGQTFTEAADHELGLACVKADNDWMVDSASTSAAVMAGRGAPDEPVDAAREARCRQPDDIRIRHVVGRDRDGRCIGARRRGRPRRHDGQAGEHEQPDDERPAQRRGDGSPGPTATPRRS